VYKGPFSNSGFKTGPAKSLAKSRPYLENRAFSKLDHAIRQGPVLKLELLNGAQVATDFHLSLITIRLSYHQMEFRFQNGKLVKDLHDSRDVSFGLPVVMVVVVMVAVEL
jgi:hypothetical protein